MRLEYRANGEVWVTLPSGGVVIAADRASLIAVLAEALQDARRRRAVSLTKVRELN